MRALVKEYLVVHEIYSERLRSFGLPAPKPYPKELLLTMSTVEAIKLDDEIKRMKKSLTTIKKECHVCRMVAKYFFLPIVVIGGLLVLLNVMAQ